MKRQETKNKECFEGGEKAKTTVGGSGAGPGEGPCLSSGQERMKDAPGPLGGWQRRDRGAEEFKDRHLMAFRHFCECVGPLTGDCHHETALYLP